MSDGLLFTPARIGRLTLPNRLLRAATSETMATADGHVTDAHLRLYGDIARGGAGLIITGHLFVEPRGQYAPRQLGIHTDAHGDGLARIVATVHAAGGRIFAELAHAGSQSVMPGVTPIAPSVIPNAIFAREPRAMTEDDIAFVVEAFAAAARRAVAAGFDGLHIHGGNGYLISEFNSPHANRRTDAWGGTPERRSRFVLDVYRAVRRAVGPDFPVSARLGMADAVDDGLTLDESLDRAAALASEGLDAIEGVYGVMRSYRDNIRPYVAVTPGRAIADWLPHRILAPPGPEAYYRAYARALKARLSIPVILVGGMRRRTTMEEVLASGDAHLLALARPFIREPDLPLRLARGQAMVACVSCNLCLRHEGDAPLQCWRKSAARLAAHVWAHYLRPRRPAEG